MRQFSVHLPTPPGRLYTYRHTVKVTCWSLTSTIIAFYCWTVNYNYNASSSTQTLKSSRGGQNDYVTTNAHYNSTFYTAAAAWVMSLCVSVEETVRWCQTATTAHCRVERRVVMWVRCNIIVLATAAWLESLCRRGRVVVVADCSAVECDDCSSQRPSRDLHCLMTGDEATSRRRMNVELHRERLLHSPTHIIKDEP